MQIKAFRVRRFEAPRPFAVISLVDERGHEGHGDAAPLPPFSPDDADTCFAALDRARDLGPIDDDRPPLDAIARALEPLALASAPSARFAIETALADLIAQRRGSSVAAILGGAAPRDVPLNGLVMPAPQATLADRAVELAEQGFQALKIKLRARGDEGFARELEALHEVRARLPLPFELRLDPNGAWSLDEARRRLDALAPIAPRYVEQPVAARDLPLLGKRAVPWAADESLAHPDLVPRLLSSPGCVAFVLKPAVLGGLVRAREVAVFAQDRGIEVVVTHLFDGPLSAAVACELAASLPRAPLACGLAPHDDLPRFAEPLGGVPIRQLAAPTVARSSGGPGLGFRPAWRGEIHG
jgi:L-alanine-DL-glutamate epimerase-like enolase superfamily enzyme